MNTNPNFPIDITPEEKQAGFRLVHTRLPLGREDVVVAALPVSRSARIVKFRAQPPYADENNVGYLLEVYCRDTHFMMRNRDEPKWDLVWNGTSRTVQAALHRYKTEALDPLMEILDAPEDPPVEPPDSKTTGNG
jgi:hypothetical protein